MGVARHILIVDDNLALAENIAEILEIEGYSTDVAGSAEDALTMAMKHNPDVVVTDYRLPGMNGVCFVEQFRRMHSRVHAVVISAYTDEGTIGEARDSGAHFMAKPVDFEVLSRWVGEGSA